MTDPKLRPGTRHCLCSDCGEYFTNVQNFDMHRRHTRTTSFCVHPSTLVSKTGKARLRRNAMGLWARPGRLGGKK